ncbi:MAG: hypothetical protein HYY14_02045 [Candidatus Omnitrophica bacterium]|nr:hypothetical protein [Candidatus Omnitrophota bacterium]
MNRVLRKIISVALAVSWVLGSPPGWAAIDTVSVVVVIASGELSVTVTPSDVNFGTVQRTASLHRFAQGPIAVTYSTTQASHIFVYTDNAENRTGLIGTNGAQMPFRAWTENFGAGVGGATPPNPQDNANWVGDTSAVWSTIPEVNEAGKLNLTEDSPVGIDTPTGRVDVYIAIDSLNVAEQEYRGTLIFEILNQ